MIGLEGAKGVGLWKNKKKGSHIFAFWRPAFQSALCSQKHHKKWEKYESLLLLQTEASKVKRDLGYVKFVIGGRSEERLSLNLHSEHCTNTDRVRNLHRLTGQKTVFTLFCNPPGGAWLRKHSVLEGKNRKIPKHRILSLVLVLSPLFFFLAPCQLLQHISLVACHVSLKLIV